jgi:hypothetical protein
MRDRHVGGAPALERRPSFLAGAASRTTSRGLDESLEDVVARIVALTRLPGAGEAPVRSSSTQDPRNP